MRVTDLFDDYLNNQLSAADKKGFEEQLRHDEILAQAFAEHKSLLNTLSLQAGKTNLKKKLNEIHDREFGVNSRIISLYKEKTFASKHGRTIAFAASTAFVAVLTTVSVLSMGGYLFKQQSNQITDLNRVVMELRASSDGIVEGITKTSKKAVYAPANLEGSAFAINNKGYILTSFHMVQGADSIFVMNTSTERTLARLILSDPKIDLAILKIDDAAVVKSWQVPFSLKEKDTDVGEKVFTLGYPRKDVVYGEGSLSSLSGYSNDTSMYQISIPVNPGNSGGPLLDENGNVIGVIRGKITGAEATGFAIKAHEILNSIELTAPDTTRKELLSSGSKKSSLKSLKRSEQIKRINPYVFNILVYKRDL
ncbi:MAG: serine protease [bacterium]|nr:serine protease [bacterium]